jgi:hypothetical protein
MGKIYDLKYRCVVLDNGYFYSDNLYIIDAMGYELQPQVDYQLLAFNEFVAAVNGKVACAVLVITNPKVANHIYVDAQMVGGDYSIVGKAINEMAMGLLNNTRKIHWANIKGKPNAFRPTGHMHPLWEWYGFTPFVVQLKRIAEAVAKQADKVYDGIYQEFDSQFGTIEDDLTAIEDRLIAHIGNKGNPHVETKAQAGLGQLQNYPLATEVQARQAHGDILTSYATPWSVGLSLDANFTPFLSQHVTDMSNPHFTTADQLKAYNRFEMDDKANRYVTLNAPMEKTTLLYGKTPDQLAPELQNNNGTGNFTRVSYPFARWSYPYLTTVPVRQQVFMPNQQWQDFDQVIKREVKPTTAITFIAGDFNNPTEALAAANLYLTDYVDGSLCFYHYQYTAVTYTGNGAIMYAFQRATAVAQRVGGTWV